MSPTDEEIEIEANYFARHLLVPDKLLLEDIKDRRLSDDLFEKLAKKYEVSIPLMTVRILEAKGMLKNV